MIDKTPPCRVCKSNKHVVVWEPEKPQETICIECCGGNVVHSDGETGHRFVNTTHDGPMCYYCGSTAVPDDYYDE